MGRLLFHDLQACKLVKQDSFGGSSDPFVKVEIAGVSQRTEVVSKSLQPVWKDQKTKWKAFEIPDPYATPCTIKFTVMDEDKLSDDFLGYVEVPLVAPAGEERSVLPRDDRQHGTIVRSEAWVLDPGVELGPRPGNKDDAALMKKNNGALGWLMFTVEYEPDTTGATGGGTAPQVHTIDAVASASQSSANLKQLRDTGDPNAPPTLTFLSLRGEDLVQSDFGGTSDPWCELKFDGVSGAALAKLGGPRKTKAVDNTLNPQWDVSSWAPVDLAGARVLPLMKFYVWDEDVTTSDFVGLGEWQIDPTHLQHNDVLDMAITLQTRPGESSDVKLLKGQKNAARRAANELGVVHARVLFQGDPTPLTISNENIAKVLPPLYEKFQASLRVTILRANNLVPAGGEGHIDPYVVIRCFNSTGVEVHKEVRTPIIDTSDIYHMSPIWNHEYLVIPDAVDVRKVTFQVMHDKRFGDTHCGYGELPFVYGNPSQEMVPVSLRPRRGENDRKKDEKFLKDMQRNHFGELMVGYKYEVVPINEQTDTFMEVTGSAKAMERRKLVVYVDQVEGLLWKDEEVFAQLHVGEGEVLKMKGAVKSKAGTCELRYAFSTSTALEVVPCTLRLYGDGFLKDQSLGETSFVLRYDHDDVEAKRHEYELQPGSDKTCLARLNNNQPAAAHMGLVTLSHQFLEVDEEADMGELANAEDDPVEAAAGGAIGTLGTYGGEEAPPPLPGSHRQQQPQRTQGPSRGGRRGSQAGGDPRTLTENYRTRNQPRYDNGGGGGGGTRTGHPAGAGRKAPTAGGFYLLLDIISAERLPMRSVSDGPDPYVIIRRDAAGCQQETKSCVVDNTASPVWWCACELYDVDPSEQFVVSVFDLDPAGYDRFLGEATLSCSVLLQGDYHTTRHGCVPLEPRRNADGTIGEHTAGSWCAPSSQYAGGVSQGGTHNAALNFQWRMIEQGIRNDVAQRPAPAPAVLDLRLHYPSNIVSSHEPDAVTYAKVTLNATDERRTPAAADGRWESEFQFPVTRTLNVAKISVWEEKPGCFTRFVGEAVMEFYTDPDVLGVGSRGGNDYVDGGRRGGHARGAGHGHQATSSRSGYNTAAAVVDPAERRFFTSFAAADWQGKHGRGAAGGGATHDGHQQVVVELKPRRDPHYNYDDVKLLNTRGSGSLGSLVVSYAFRAAQSAKRQFTTTQPYTVVVNVLEVADLNYDAAHADRYQHYVTAETKHDGVGVQGVGAPGGGGGGYEVPQNGTRCSHLLHGPSPKFRSQFEFRLGHDYEEIVLRLVRRELGRGPETDEEVAYFVFPVGPSQSQAAVSEKTWCSFIPTQTEATRQHHPRRGGAGTAAAHPTSTPRVLFMWKAVVDPAMKQEMAHQSQLLAQQHTTAASYTHTPAQPAWPAAGTGSPYPAIHGPAATPPHPHHPYYAGGGGAVVPHAQYPHQPQGAYNADVSETEYLRGQVSQLAAQNEGLRAQLHGVSGGRHGGWGPGQHPHPHHYPHPQQSWVQPAPGGPLDPSRNDGTATVVVENHETRQKRYLNVPLPADAGYVIERARHTMSLPIGEYVCRWGGADAAGGDLLEGLQEGDTIVVQRSERFLARRSPRYDRSQGAPGFGGGAHANANAHAGASAPWIPPGIATTSPARRGGGRSPTAITSPRVHFTDDHDPRAASYNGYYTTTTSYTPGYDAGGGGYGPTASYSEFSGRGGAYGADSRMQTNNAVLSRLRMAARQGQEHLTAALWLPRADDGDVVETCITAGFPGFARPHAVRDGWTEVVLQGSAANLAPFVLELVQLAEGEGVLVELVEVKGYIPVLTTDFRLADSLEEGAHMWERGCEPCNVPGAGRKAWFYRSLDCIEDGTPGIVVIDERAP